MYCEGEMGSVTSAGGKSGKSGGGSSGIITKEDVEATSNGKSGKTKERALHNIGSKTCKSGKAKKDCMHSHSSIAAPVKKCEFVKPICAASSSGGKSGKTKSGDDIQAMSDGKSGKSGDGTKNLFAATENGGKSGKSGDGTNDIAATSNGGKSGKSGAGSSNLGDAPTMCQ